VRDHYIAVIIPAYKVETKISRVIQSIPDFVRSIIVVIDGSPDRTAEIIQKISDPRLIVINHEKNQGVGGAMITGYNKALDLGADIMVKVDGDDQMDTARIIDLIRPIIKGEADFTKGNRFMHELQMKSMPLVRRIGNWGLTFLVKVASGYWNIFDPSNGFTAIHAQVWRFINQQRIAKDYFFESSLLVELRFLNAVVQDVYIPARYQDEESSLSIFRVLFTFPSRLIKATIRRFVYQYYLYNFSFGSLAFIVGLIFVIFGFVWGVVYWIKSINTGIPATTGTVLIAVLPIILGVQLLLQVVSQDIAEVPRKVIHNSLLPNQE
jgi:glycosyltransferase involved in cell wall biosynthesis